MTSRAQVGGDHKWVWVEVRPARPLRARELRRLSRALNFDADCPWPEHFGVDGLPPFCWRYPLWTEAHMVEALERALRGVGGRWRYAVGGRDCRVDCEDCGLDCPCPQCIDEYTCERVDRYSTCLPKWRPEDWREVPR